jgi:succinoglycan biosynthesis transport protein ExoP
MAITLAQSGRKVILVDTDLRKPRAHKALGVSPSPGVTNCIVGEASLEESIRSTEVPNLWILPAGPIPPNPAELLQTEAFKQLRLALQERFDTVVFDSPPLTAVVDAAIIGTQVDGVVVVAHAKRTTRHSLSSLLRQLNDVNARILGGVINDVNPSGTGYGYAYGGRYYYGGAYYSDGVDAGRNGSGDNPPANDPV